MTFSDDAIAIAVVVVSHQSAATIDECLCRLRAARDVAEIRVVDNDSQDGTLDIIQRHCALDPRMRFIGNPDNPGFAIACNQGARETHAPWLAFVNPDLLVDADTLAKLRIRALQSDADLLGVELVDEHGRCDAAARRRDPDFAAMLRSFAATRLAVPRSEGVATQPVDAVSGALMLTPRALFDDLRGFDEGYRLHVEDLDLCRRARALGATVAVANDVRVLHYRGVSSHSRPVFVEWHKHRGLWRYWRKFDAGKHGISANVGVFALIWLRFPLAMLAALLK